MALINCPECKKEISDKAQSCPYCGCPVSAVTIEQTSKKWKGWQLLGCLTSILGIVLIMGHMTKWNRCGGILIYCGILIYIIAKIGIWWYHK